MQTLLDAGGWVPGPIDGVCGRRTLSAILAFQRHFMHLPDGLIEPRGRSWLMLHDGHQRRTNYRSLTHSSIPSTPPSRTRQRTGLAEALPVPGAPTAVAQRPVAQAHAIRLTDEDILDLKKTLQTEWAAFAGNEQAYGIIDTILNRLASGHWGDRISGVVNARKQFSDINGPPAWNGKDHIGIGSHDRVEQIPTSTVTSRTARLVDGYLVERARGRPSIVGTNLDYANPDPRVSSANNLGWINKLSGPSFGRGAAIHRHGTTADKERFRPRPYYILLPPNPD